MDRKINLRPIMLIAVSLCLGQFFAYLGYIYKFSLSIILLVLLAVILFILPLFYSRGRKLKALILYGVTAVILFVGYFNFFQIVSNFNKAKIIETNYTVVGKVDSINYVDDTHSCIILRNLTFKQHDLKSNYKLKLYIYDDVELRKGDLITFSAQVNNVKTFFENKLSINNVVNRIKYTATVDEYSYKITGYSPTIFDSGYNFISSTIEKGLSKNDYPIALALLTGDDAFMSDEVISAFRQGGVAHIFAVSGLHIGFLATILAFVLKKTRIIKIILIPIVLFLYSGICGFTSSSIRAAIMISVALIASRMGEKYDSLSALSLSAIVVLLFEPLQLFTAGFILSFSVVFCMLTLGKRITNLLSFLPDKIATAIGGVISAQLGSIPASLHFFNSFSFVAPAVNLIIIPLISIVFMLIFFGVFIGGIFSISRYALFLQNILISVLRRIFLFLDFDIFIVENISLGAYVIVYFALIIILAKMVKLSKIINIISTISLSLILIFGCTFNSIVNYNQTYIVVTRSYGINATIFHKRENTSLIITNRDYEFNFNNLNRFLNSQSTSELNEVIILNQSIDVQTTVSALISMYDIEKVIYVNNYSQDSLNSFFKNKINFEHYDFGETYDGIFGNITFVDDGVTVCKNNFKILFANSALDLSNYYADVLIAPSVYEDSEDNFASIYTYNKNNYYLNCVNDGNLVFKIDNGTFKRC